MRALVDHLLTYLLLRYLMHLNTLSGRTYNDLTCYPVRSDPLRTALQADHTRARRALCARNAAGHARSGVGRWA